MSHPTGDRRGSLLLPVEMDHACGDFIASAREGLADKGCAERQPRAIRDQEGRIRLLYSCMPAAGALDAAGEVFVSEPVILAGQCFIPNSVLPRSTGTDTPSLRQDIVILSRGLELSGVCVCNGSDSGREGGGHRGCLACG